MIQNKLVCWARIWWCSQVTPALRKHSLQCWGQPVRCWEPNPSWLLARQVPFPLCYGSGPCKITVLAKKNAQCLGYCFTKAQIYTVAG